jgi:hypothetical protein
MPHRLNLACVPLGLFALLAFVSTLPAQVPSPLPSNVCRVQPPVDSSDKAQCAADSYFQSISCLYGSRSFEVEEIGDHWVVRVRDSKPIGAHSCRTETVWVCKSTGVLVWSDKEACVAASTSPSATLMSPNTSLERTRERRSAKLRRRRARRSAQPLGVMHSSRQTA